MSFFSPYSSGHVNAHKDRYGWTGWTQSIHWMAPTGSGVFTGFGIYVIFLQCFNYLIDSYLQL